MSSLTQADYKTILVYYNISYANLPIRDIKRLAHEVLANKLCRCIKKAVPHEKTAIPICINSIFKKKNIKISRFTCKKRPTLFANRNTRRVLTKFKKTH